MDEFKKNAKDILHSKISDQNSRQTMTLRSVTENYKFNQETQRIGTLNDNYQPVVDNERLKLIQLEIPELKEELNSESSSSNKEYLNSGNPPKTKLKLLIPLNDLSSKSPVSSIGWTKKA